MEVCSAEKKLLPIKKTQIFLYFDLIIKVVNYFMWKESPFPEATI